MGTASKNQPGNLTPKKVFIVDDHPVFREGLAQLIKREPDLVVCGQAENATDALRGIIDSKPDLALVDITLPGKSGLELIKEVRAVDRTIKLLVVSMHDEALYANRVLRLGGDGYIMKQEDPSEIISAIHDVLDGHIYVSEEVLAAGAGSSAGKTVAQPVAKKPERPLSRLTDSELEILELLGKGQSNEEIAQQLRLNAEAIGAACAEMKRKLRLKADNALVRYAVCWVETGRT